MSKLKDFFSDIAKAYKKNILQYTVAHIVMIITTAILVFGDYNFLEKILEQIVIIGVISAINAFTSESFCKKTWQRVLTGIIGIVIAVIFERLIWLDFDPAITRITIGYCIIVFLIGIIKVIKNSKLEFHEYFTQIFQNLFSTGIIYLILNLGLSIIMIIFITLLLDDFDSLDLLLRLQIALVGWFLAPACLTAITNIKYNISKFIETIIAFVFLPLTILAAIIIYIYMAKIFITREIPSNSIFRILTGLFIAAFIVWIMAYNFKEKNKMIEKFCKAMPVAFIPFVCLQIYSIGTRCIENGITPMRYLGIMFIIFEIIAIFLSLYKNRKHLIHVLTASIIIITIVTILPIVNMQTISNISQSNRLKKAWRQGESYSNLTKDQKDTVESAYNYLETQDDGKKYIPDYIPKDILKNNKNYFYDRTDYIYYNASSNMAIPVQGYKYIQEANDISYYKINDESLREIYLDNKVCINIENYILNIINEKKANKRNIEDYIKKNAVINIDEQKDLYIKSISIRYIKEENITIDNIESVYITGYVLTK